MPKKLKFYAVKQGHNPGVYLDWGSCSEQVIGFPGAIYKSFSSRAEAEAFLDIAPTGATVSAVQAPLIPGLERSRVPVTKKAKKTDVLPQVSEVDRTVIRSRGPRLEKVEIYTDGGCFRNPGPGGYGVVILADGKRKELSGGFRKTTNNRMELMACIFGLQELGTKCEVAVWTDSQYLVNGISKGWAKRWQKDGWLRGDQEVPNADLWQRLLDLRSAHKITFNWLRGHSGHKENERCDELATLAQRQRNLPVDEVYERQSISGKQ